MGVVFVNLLNESFFHFDIIPCNLPIACSWFFQSFNDSIILSLFASQKVFLDLTVSSLNVNPHDADVGLVDLLLELNRVVVDVGASSFVVDVDRLVHAARHDLLGFLLFIVFSRAVLCIVQSELAFIHKLDQIGLENLLPAWIFVADHWELVRALTVAALLMLVWVDVFHAETIKHEHPLIDLELIDVELAHKFNHFDGFAGQCSILLIWGFLSEVSIFESRHEFCLQMRPKSLQSFG